MTTEPKHTPCGLCGTPTPMTGTKRCHRCYELEGRIQDNKALAFKILGVAPAILADNERLRSLLDGLPDVELDGLATQGGVKAVMNRLCADNERLREALRDCDTAFVSWQVGQIPGRPEDILALIAKVRAALSATEKP